METAVTHASHPFCQITVLHLLSPVASNNTSLSCFIAIYFLKSANYEPIIKQQYKKIINNKQHYCNKHTQSTVHNLAR